MKLRDLLEIATNVDIKVADSVTGAVVTGDEFDLLYSLNEEWLDAEVQNIEVDENLMTVELEVR
jgi:hypothetical protein